MAYQGRRAPNVSAYLQGLNTVPSAQDVAPQDDLFADGSLDFLSTTEFFEFDEFNGAANFPSGAAGAVVPEMSSQKPGAKNGATAK
ncbi:hypothetical protein LTR53_019501, partial [Teratosphaeriaceae sp. CCFEE 6253]